MNITKVPVNELCFEECDYEILAVIDNPKHQEDCLDRITVVFVDEQGDHDTVTTDINGNFGVSCSYNVITKKQKKELEECEDEFDIREYPPSALCTRDGEYNVVFYIENPHQFENEEQRMSVIVEDVDDGEHSLVICGTNGCLNIGDTCNMDIVLREEYSCSSIEELKKNMEQLEKSIKDLEKNINRK